MDLSNPPTEGLILLNQEAPRARLGWQKKWRKQGLI
jgi:hypothetical protein